MKKHLLISLTAGFSNARVGENLGIRYIKSFLNKHGYHIDILENQFYSLNNEELAEIIQSYDVIGFSINYCGQIEILRHLLKQINPDNKILYLGGHFASICYRNLLKEFTKINFVMLADGELPTLELIRKNYKYESIFNIAFINAQGNLIENPIYLAEDLDILAFPYRDKNSYYMGDNHFSMISSRGCYNRCTYCSVGAYTQKYFKCTLRFRSAKNIFSELMELKKLDVNYVTFQDDLFIGTDKASRERAKELAILMIKNNLNIYFSIQCSVKSIDYDIFLLLYKAGLRNVMIGIENFSPNALKHFNKKQTIFDVKKSIEILRSIGLSISYGFIMYYPEMNVTEILENVKILYDLHLLNIRAITSILQIYVGTDYCHCKCDNVDLNISTYKINYTFKDIRLSKFIDECKLFSKKYSKLENQLYHMEFLSHSNKQINMQKIDNYFSEFKKCIYLFTTAKYYELFDNRKVENDYEKRLEVLEELIQAYFKESHLYES